MVEQTGQVTDLARSTTLEQLLRETEERYRQLVELCPDAIVVHCDGKLVLINSAALRLFGVDEPAKWLGRSVLELVHPDARPIVAERIGRMLKEGTSVPLIAERFLRLDGSAIDVEVAGGPFMFQGRPAVQVVFRDVTERKRAEEDLARSERNYRAVFEEANDGIIVFEPETETILDANSHACDLYGYSRNELLGMSLKRLTKDVTRGEREIAALLEVGRRQDFETVHRARDGREINVLSRASIIDFGGRKAVLSIIRDITEHKQAEAALRESELQFRTLAETASTGIVIHAGEEILYSNAAAARITGFSPQELLTMKFWEPIHPDFREAVRGRGVARLTGAPDLPSQYETKFLTKAGEERWVNLTSGAISLHGQPALVVTLTDVTEQHRLREVQAAIYGISEATQAVGNLDDLYRAIHVIIGRLMNARNLYIALHDPTTNLISFPYFVDEFDTTPEPFPCGPGMTSYVIRSGQPLLATPGVLRELEARGEVVRLGSDAIDWLGVPLRVQDKIIGVLAVQSYVGSVRYTETDQEVLSYVSAQVAQAIERKRAEEALEDRTRQLEALNVELRRLSRGDALTGLANRRHFDDRLGQEWRRAKRTGTSLALVSMDIDNFKEVNDAHGHLHGDACLQRLGAYLSTAFGRASDLPARLGGDEFCLILADTSLEGAVLAAEKLRTAFEALAIPRGVSKNSGVVTLSLGAAAGVPGPELTADGLLRVADKALYMAKEQGRNRVCALSLKQSPSPLPPGAAAPGGQQGRI